MENTIEKIINKIENKLQFTTTIAIFFPALMYGYFMYSGLTEHVSQSNAVTYWGYLVGMYILIYVLFNILQKYISEKQLKFLNIISLFDIGSFIFPIVYLSLITPETISKYHFIATHFSLMTYAGSIILMLIFPIITTATIMLFWIWPMIVEIFICFKNIFNKWKSK